MTIRASINIRHWNDRLSLLGRCVETCPEGTHERAQDVAGLVGRLTDGIMQELRAEGFGAANGDTLREIEAMIYAYLVESNHEPSFLTVAEGFGEHIDGPAGERVLAQAVRDRNCLSGLRG